MTLCIFLYSVLASITAIVLIYLFYIISGSWVRNNVAKGECWWLPGAKTFRFVIRNLYSHQNIFDIQYHVWLRRDIPPMKGISINTLDDREICEGKRLLLPVSQDLPLLCFRLKKNRKSDLEFIITDKMGKKISSYPIEDDSFRVMIEFSARTRTWWLIKHEVRRIYAIPQLKTLHGKRINIFREILLPMQSTPERQMKLISQYAYEVTSTV
jgi:hypothetical protein